MTLVRLEPAAPRSQVKHTVLARLPYDESINSCVNYSITKGILFLNEYQDLAQVVIRNQCVQRNIYFQLKKTMKRLFNWHNHLQTPL